MDASINKPSRKLSSIPAITTIETSSNNKSVNATVRSAFKGIWRYLKKLKLREIKISQMNNYIGYMTEIIKDILIRMI